jgi:hypothetical protein
LSHSPLVSFRLVLVLFSFCLIVLVLVSSRLPRLLSLVSSPLARSRPSREPQSPHTSRMLSAASIDVRVNNAR